MHVVEHTAERVHGLQQVEQLPPDEVHIVALQLAMLVVDEAGELLAGVEVD